MPTKGPDTVAVFWDYENCPAPSNASGYSIANNICALARPFGVVKLFKAYLEISDQYRSITLRSELQSSGISLVDCPHNGRKEVADKMLLVDMLAYALDNPAPTTIILITGDRDFAYALSILKHRQYQVVLVTLSNAHASLVHQACLCFDWFNDVINQSDTTNSQHRNKVQQDLFRGMRPSSPYSDADADENDYEHLRKETRADGFFAYPTRNTRAPYSPSKSSRNTPFQPIRENSPVSSRPQTSAYTTILEDEATGDVCSGPSPIKSRQRDRLPRFPTSRTSRGEESSNAIPSSKKSLIGRIEIDSLTPEPSYSSASPRKESDREIERGRPIIIPNIYVFLVKILQGHRRKGITHSYRSVIASKMAHEQPTYRKAGVNTFAEFMDLAERNGILELGGTGKDAWVRLLPEWYDGVAY